MSPDPHKKDQVFSAEKVGRDLDASYRYLGHVYRDRHNTYRYSLHMEVILFNVQGDV